MRSIIDMAADRGAYICQSQSLNLFINAPNTSKLTSMHFYAWKKGLKTGMYYLRSTAAADAIQFTLDKTAMQPAATEAKAVNVAETIAQPVVAAVAEPQQAIQYTAADYEQKRADMACSLDNPDACEACGS